MTTKATTKPEASNLNKDGLPKGEVLSQEQQAEYYAKLRKAD